MKNRPLGNQARIGAALAIALLATPFAALAVSVLAPGDVAIIGYNGKDNDNFAFASLVDIDPGVTITFRNLGDGLPGGTVTYSPPAGGLAAGGVVVMLNPKNGPVSASDGGSCTADNYNYNSAQDYLEVYQGATALYASESMPAYTPPAGLSAAAGTVVSHPEGANPGRSGRYRGTSPRSGTKQEILDALKNTANWEYQTADVGTAFYEFNIAPYNTAFTVQAEPPGGTQVWTGTVVDGFYYPNTAIFVPGQTLTAAGIVGDVQTDNNDAISKLTCFANSGSTRNIFSVFFDNDFPAGAAIAKVEIIVQHQGASGQSGTLQVHVSDDRGTTTWYSGSKGGADAVSGDYAWSATEGQIAYDVTGLLNTVDKINNCEVQLVNLLTSFKVYFDYIAIRVEYQASGVPAIHNAGGATSVTATSARLNGELTQGAPNPLVLILWGDEAGGADLGGWDHTENLGAIGIGPFNRTVTGLTANKTYHYRCYATNGLGEAWAPTSSSFTTAGPTLQFTPSLATAPESTSAVTMTIAMNAVSALPVTVNYAATGGTATPGADFTLAAGSVTIPPGRTTTNLTLTIIEDTLDEADETVIVSLSSPVHATLAATSTFTCTIEDNDPLPPVAFVAQPYNVVENEGPATVTVRLGQASGRQVSVSYQTVNGSAVAGTDYTATSGTLIWPAGNTTDQTVDIPIIDNAQPGSNIVFSVNLHSPVNAAIAGTNPETVTIFDNDLGTPTVNNAFGATQVSSNSASLRGELLATGGSETRTWIYYGPADGTTNKTAWASFVDTGITTPGPFSALAANLAEHTTYFYRCFSSNGFGGAWAPTSPQFLTGPPTVRFASAASQGDESLTPVKFDLVLSDPADYAHDVTVNYGILFATATGGGVDYSLHGSSVVIPAGSSTTGIYATVTNDALDENQEFFRILLFSAVNAGVGAPNQHQYDILDNDPLPQVAFSGAPFSALENAGSVSVAIALLQPSGRTVTLRAETGNGSAVAGVDYAARSELLSWSAGDTSARNLDITVIDDDVSEGNRFFYVTLKNVTNATVTGTNPEVVSIIEDDNTPAAVHNDAGADNVRSSMARLNGEVTGGIPPPDVFVYWGPVDGGTTPANWAATNLLAARDGRFATEALGLTPGTLYFYRCFASNGAGGSWAPAAASFTTTTAADYYVNDAGTADDVYTTAPGHDANAGTSPNAPKATLQALLSAHDLEPGDTVYIDTGLYNLSSTVTIGAGDAGSAAGGTVLFRGSTHAAGSTLNRGSTGSHTVSIAVNGPAYVHLRDLRVTGGQRGISVSGDALARCEGVILENCRVTGNSGSADGAIYLKHALRPVVTGCHVADNGVSGIAVDTCLAANISSNVVSGHQAYGIWIISATDPVIEHNVCSGQNFYANFGNGIFGTAGSGESINHNTCFDNGETGIWLSGLHWSLTGNHAYDNGLDGIHAEGNGTRLNGSRVHGNGRHGLDTSGTAGLECLNNLAYNNAGYNIHFSGANNTILFENNTVYGGAGVRMPSPLNVTNRHNIFTADGAGKRALVVETLSAGTDRMVSDYNCFRATGGATVGQWGGTPCGTFADWQSVTWKDGNSLGVDPLFVDPDGAEDFHLQSRAGSWHGGLWNTDAANSPCIDAGDPLAAYVNEPAYNGLRVNLGAYGNGDQASLTDYDGALYSLNLTASPPEAGAVHMLPQSALYPTNVLITAWAVVTNADYAFSGWTGDLTSSSLTNTFTLTTNMTLQAVFVLLLSNTNGVPDSWLVTYGLPPGQEGADADSDGDGHLNWMEYYAGTIPTNAASVLRLADIATVSGRIAVHFFAVEGKLYRIQAASALPAGNWTNIPASLTPAGALTEDNIAGLDGIKTVYIALSPGARALRVALQMP